MKMIPKASVIICTYNDEKYLSGCIRSILDNSFKNFELIIVNDASTDNTDQIIKSFKDKRIRYYVNKKNMGSIGKTRNYAFSLAKGKYVLSTDSDCYVRKDWIEKMIVPFKEKDIVAVEGQIIYVSESYKRTFSDVVVSNIIGNMFMAGNMAYRLDILKKESFNPAYKAFEDRELGMRLKKYGRIFFEKRSIIYHQIKKMSIRTYLNLANRSESRVMLFKNINDRAFMSGRILHLKQLIKLLIPPLVLGSLFRNRFESWEDYKLIPFIYVKIVYMRYIIWKTAIKYGVFVI